MKIIVLFITLLLLPATSSNLFGQNDTINQTEGGLKQGYWIVYGKDMPEKGYPSDGKIEEGPYKDGRKHGMWKKYHKDGKTVRLEGMYRMGRPNGQYTKRHENGEVREQGTYTNRKQVGEFVIKNDKGIVTQKKTFNESGREEGVVQIFYDDGTLQMEMTKKDGQVVGDAVTYWPNGDVKKKVSYGSDGEIVSKKDNIPRVNPPKNQHEIVGGGGPSGSKGVKKDGTPFSRDGYNKLYNKNDEIWMDGEFKSGKLWNGKLYKYDADGILLKIEIWKDGKYHSDGQL